MPPRRIRKRAVCLSVPESINVRKYVSEIIGTPYLDYWASNQVMCSINLRCQNITDCHYERILKIEHIDTVTIRLDLFPTKSRQRKGRRGRGRGEAADFVNSNL